MEVVDEQAQGTQVQCVYQCVSLTTLEHHWTTLRVEWIFM